MDRDEDPKRTEGSRKTAGITVADGDNINIDGTTINATHGEDARAHIVDGDRIEQSKLEGLLVRTIDWRLCTIAGILCSLNLLDSGIISSASVTR